MIYKKPDEIWVFRILHYQNIEHILKFGLHTAESSFAHPNYTPIGDTSLISHRNTFLVKINPPNGVLGDYIPFYFGVCSPMLYRVKTGYGGVQQFPQREIIYLCCKLEDMIQSEIVYFFTDGQANNSFSKHYNNLDDLDKVDWSVVYKKDWRHTDEDFDRMRRKQAEFLVKSHIPAKCISRIVVFDENMLNFASIIINKLSLNIEILINPKQKFYY